MGSGLDELKKVLKSGKSQAAPQNTSGLAALKEVLASPEKYQQKLQTNVAQNTTPQTNAQSTTQNTQKTEVDNSQKIKELEARRNELRNYSASTPIGCYLR